jgi:hypothetical protein
MQRSLFCSLAVLALFTVGLAMAKNDKDKNHDKATIAQVDSKKGTITLRVKNQDGKEVDRTFALADGAEYVDSAGKVAKIDAFLPGDHVLFTEKDGKIKELKKAKELAEATITKVDAKKGVATVKMQDNGKEVEKTFKLAENIVYMDSSGKVADVDILTSGDKVLIVEVDGTITRMQKKDKAPTTKKEEYTREMHKLLDEFDVKCKQLEASISKAEGQAKKDLEKTLAQAKVKRGIAVKKLDELKEAGEDRWEKVKEGVGSAFDELKSLFQ